MELYQASFFCTDKDYEPIPLECEGRFAPGDNWPITFFIGTGHGDTAICFHLAGLDQLRAFRDSFIAAVEKVTEDEAKTRAAAPMQPIPFDPMAGELQVQKASEL